MSLPAVPAPPPPKAESVPRPTASYLPGFDYLRAVASVAVVIIHLGYIAPTVVKDPARWRDYRFTPIDALNLHGLLLAVPIFFLMSCFLLARSKSADPGRRIARIVRMLVFWATAIQIFDHGFLGFLKAIPRRPFELLIFLVSGFNTLFYFFVSLALMLAVVAWARSRSNRLLIAATAVSTLILAMLPLLACRIGRVEIVSHYCPLNFLPYPFLAILCTRLPRERSTAAILLSFAAGVPLAFADWYFYRDPLFFRIDIHALPGYTRPSLVFLATGVLLVALRIRRQPGPVVRFMSGHSLALYCLHPFAMVVLYWAGGMLGFVTVFPLSLVLVVAASYAASVLVLPWILKPELYQ